MTILRMSLLGTLTLTFILSVRGQAEAQENDLQKHVVTVERIWDRAAHSAFTDMIRYRGDLYCTFREGSGHIPGRNGLIRVIRSRDGMNWTSISLLEERHVDLRDPKLSITSDGRLMVNSGASYYHDQKRVGIESRVAFYNSENQSFDKPQKVIFPKEASSGFDWLWRVTWHKDWAWGCVQQVPNKGKRALHLVRSRDGVRYEHVKELNVPSPTETTLRFLDDDTMIAMIRRTGSEPTGWIGRAAFPYTDWKYRASNKRFGGPNFMQLPSGEWLAGSRDYGGEAAKTALWKFDPDAGEFDDLLQLPSGGDTSYPGFSIDAANQCVWISYYSSHEGKSAIYLATLRLEASQPPENR